ncbi:hypothetical protein ACFOW6_14945 [Fodinicurvata halophila]|uniref:Uncharacterized protein n=1 Tax=Fodinicurvata halophila TaxID=1419723 RepID=A0ABV8UNK6_9PROT
MPVQFTLEAAVHAGRLAGEEHPPGVGQFMVAIAFVQIDPFDRSARKRFGLLHHRRRVWPE